ncbi:MAG: rane-associated zinc metalloprotease, partial [Steroidobacteraceae bacterium]|nr:rane-associated zinc metalloprotease [Steroidobacteraceae bacterium]
SMTILTYVLAFLVAIGVLVAVHEYGHFWMARRMGIKVLRYSIGFGKVLWSRRAADGCEYAFSAIPLGGYVKLLDEREGPVPPELLTQAYNRKPVWRRILVLLAGPFANFLFAAVAYWILFVVGIPALKPVIGDVIADSPAAAAGLRSGDSIVAVAGAPVATREGAVLSILDRLMDGAPIELTVRADEGEGSPRTLDLAIEGDRRGLTEPGALLPGLGFDFWYPTVPTEIGKIVPGSPAARANLALGDRIVAVDGEPVADFASLVERVQPSPGKTLRFTIERKGGTFEVPIEVESQRDGARLVGRIGIQPVPNLAVPDNMRALERYGVVQSAGRAVGKTWDMSVLKVRMIWNVATGDVSVKNLSGPINIAEYAGFSARQGILSFLSFLAIVSVSLFVLNLLPIPILDGGQVVYQVAELVKGSPLSDRAQAVGQQIGILLLLVLMSFAFYNDLSRLFS